MLTNSPSKFLRRAAAAGNGLLNNLVYFYPLNEAAGANDALDLHSNALHLTQNGSPGSDTGKVYATARTMADVADVFTRASETALQIGTGDWTVALWVYFSAESSTGNWMFNKRGEGTPALEYQIIRLASDDKIYASVGNGTDAFLAISSATAALNEWHFIVAGVDSAAHTINVSLNGAAPQSAAYTGTLLSSTNALYVGNAYSGASALAHVGRLGPVAMWKSGTGNGGVLSEAQRAALWNGGAGLPYAAYTA